MAQDDPLILIIDSLANRIGKILHVVKPVAACRADVVKTYFAAQSPG